MLEEFIYKHSFYVHVNLNDTFYYASSDGEDIEVEDIKKLMPLCKKYGIYAVINAYVSIKRKALPLKQLRDKKLIQAIREIKDLYQKDKWFMSSVKIDREEL